MKLKILLLILFISFQANAVIDSQILIKPNQAYMNYFMDGYLSWHEKIFGMRPDLGNKIGNEFLSKAIKRVDHWRTPEHPLLDQFLLGQGFNSKGKPFYNFRVYIAKELRDHPFIKGQKLPFTPLFVERSEQDGVCFLGEIKLADISWKSVPRVKSSYYLQHFCQNSLKYISYISKHEAKIFPNRFAGQADYEIQTFSPEKLVLIFQYVKTTHTAFVLPQHIPYINQHGQETLLPFDKLSVNEKGDMVIYYP